MSDRLPVPTSGGPALPGGTVTFLFTDIEGSTRLLQKLGEAYASVRTDHHRILRDAAAARGGREVDSQGDAFFFVFGRARDGIMAAADAQRELASHQWPDGAALRVRMGIHTGEPHVGEDGYLGLDVVRAARICAAAHGGQVLVSQTTRALIGGDEPEGVGLLNLGEHRLKDIDGREPLFQLVLAGLPSMFERPRTLEEQPEQPSTLNVAGSRDFGRHIADAVRGLQASIERGVADELRAAGIGAASGPSPAPPSNIPWVHRSATRSEMVFAAVIVTVVFGFLAAIAIALLVLVF